MRTSETLRAARSLIDTPEKWNGGLSWRAGGSCVAQGFVTALGTSYVSDGQRMFARVLGLPDATYSLYRWNDAPERTHADLLAAFDTAISYAEASEQEFSPSACAPVDSIAGQFAKAHEGNI